MDESVKSIVESVVAFRDARDWSQFHTPRHLSAAIAIEASELQETMLWKSDTEVADAIKDPAVAERIRHEVADVLIYSLSLCDRLGLDPSDIVREKLSLNEKKYPVDVVRGRADKYDQYRSIADDRGRSA